MAHVKRIAAPRSWPIRRKVMTYIMKQDPGPHSLSLSIPLGVLLRDMLGVVHTMREARRALHERKIKVDSVIRTSLKFPVGLFDVISFADEQYRVFLNTRGRLFAEKIPAQENIKLAKIVRKTAVRGKIQCTLNDGCNILLDKSSLMVGDSVVLALPSREFKHNLPFAKESLIFLVKGSHIGEIGTIKDISGNKIVYELPEKGVFETQKNNAFVIGKDKPVITIK